MQQVDLGEPAEELGVGTGGGIVERRADLREQAGQRVDRDAAPSIQRLARDEHRERRLAGSDIAEEPQSTALGESLVQCAHVAPHHVDLRAGHVGHGRGVERHAPVSTRYHGRQRASAAVRDELRPAGAPAHATSVLVVDPAGAVAAVERAGVVHAASRSWLRKRGYSCWNVSFTSPRPPLRCLAMMISLVPGSSDSSRL